MLKEELFKFFNSLSFVSSEQFENFWEITNLITLKPGELFISPETQQHKMGVVLSGALKSYFLTHEGNHHIRAFLSKFDISAAFSSAALGYKPDLFVEAINESKLIYFDYEEFKKLSESSSELNALAHKLLEIEFIKNEKKEYCFSTKSIEENFMLINEELSLKKLQIMQKDIANYLGITDIAYSRIKKRIFNKEN